MRVRGTFNGTGAACYLCLGFVPSEFHLMALEDSDLAEGFWKRNFRAAEVAGGFTMVTGTTYRQITALTKGTGFEPYYGGDVMDTTVQTDVAYGGGVYLRWDDTDYSKDLTYGGVSILNKWTLAIGGTTCNGYFNDDIVTSGSRIGEGSKITVQKSTDGTKYNSVVESVTGGAGHASGDVVLSNAVPTGDIRRISGMYSMIPVPIGETTTQGIHIIPYTLINVNDEIQAFEAVCDVDEKV